MLKKKPAKSIIDSRYLKILAVKKSELKDSVVFINLDETKYGSYDVAELRQLAISLDKIEPNGCYFLGLKNLNINVFDRDDIKNKNLIVTVGHSADADSAEVEKGIKIAFADAKDVTVVHQNVTKIDVS